VVRVYIKFWVIILFFGWGTLKYLFVKSVRFKTTQDFSRILNFWGSFYSPYSHSVRDKYLLFSNMHSYVENRTLKWHIKSFVKSICGRIIIELLLSSVSKHNMWSYYDWVYCCCRPSVQQRQLNHNTTTYCVYWRTTTTTTQS
jgi:hypothetical protein